MRWLTKYPITAEEVMQSLESIPQINPPGTPPRELRIGGVQDTVRARIIDYFRNQDNMDALLEAIRKPYSEGTGPSSSGRRLARPRPMG